LAAEKRYFVQFFSHNHGEARTLIAETTVLATSEGDALTRARANLQQRIPEVATCKYFSIQTA
jgi:hypothetical protein